MHRLSVRKYNSVFHLWMGYRQNLDDDSATVTFTSGWYQKATTESSYQYHKTSDTFHLENSPDAHPEVPPGRSARLMGYSMWFSGSGCSWFTSVRYQAVPIVCVSVDSGNGNNDCKAGGYKNNVRKGTKPYPMLSAFSVSADRKILLRPIQISIKS